MAVQYHGQTFAGRMYRTFFCLGGKGRWRFLLRTFQDNCSILNGKYDCYNIVDCHKTYLSPYTPNKVQEETSLKSRFRSVPGFMYGKFGVFPVQYLPMGQTGRTVVPFWRVVWCKRQLTVAVLGYDVRYYVKFQLPLSYIATGGSENLGDNRELGFPWNNKTDTSRLCAAISVRSLKHTVQHRQRRVPAFPFGMSAIGDVKPETILIGNFHELR